MLQTLNGETYQLDIKLGTSLVDLQTMIEVKTGVKRIHQELYVLENEDPLCLDFTPESEIFLVVKVPDPVTLSIYLLDGSLVVLPNFDRVESFPALLKKIKLEYQRQYGYYLTGRQCHLYHEDKLKITDTRQLEDGDHLYLIL